MFKSYSVIVMFSAMVLLPSAVAQQRSGNNGADELEQRIREDIAQQNEDKIKEDVVRQQEQKIRDDILQQLPQDIMKVLLQQNLLNRQIDRGINDYFKQQKEAHTAALEKQQKAASEKASNVRRVTAARDHIYGDPNAPISLIEYSDFECPFCKHFQPTPKEVVDASGGAVNWVYRHFPLGMHNPGSEKEAEASECANSLGGNNTFWRYANTIYARTQSNGKGFPVSQLVPLAKEIGLNKRRFRECLDSGRFASRVQEDSDEGGKIGVEATPTNILLDSKTGQVILRSGAVPPEALKVDIDNLVGGISSPTQPASR
jgi:protein-disulfide isomerase